jgi:hypothetical protein
VHEMLAPGQRPQHGGRFSCVRGLPERFAVQIDDGVRGDDQTGLAATGNGIGLRFGVKRGQFARSKTWPVSFIDVARKDAHVQAERAQ